MITDPLFYAAAVPAVILLGLSKGGFRGIGLLALPMMALVISPIRAAAILLPILIVQDSVAVWAYRRAFDRHNLVILLPSAAIGVLTRLSSRRICLGCGHRPRGRSPVHRLRRTAIAG